MLAAFAAAAVVMLPFESEVEAADGFRDALEATSVTSRSRRCGGEGDGGLRRHHILPR